MLVVALAVAAQEEYEQNRRGDAEKAFVLRYPRWVRFTRARSPGGPVDDRPSPVIVRVAAKSRHVAGPNRKQFTLRDPVSGPRVEQ